jgi:hypothetical protein
MVAGRRALVVAYGYGGELTVAARITDQVPGDPLVEAAAVPHGVLVGPLVADVVGALTLLWRGRGGGDVEGEQGVWGTRDAARGVALPEDPRAVVTRAEPNRAIVEAAHSLVPPEVVVERTVLLDEDDDVLDVGEAAACRLGGRDCLDESGGDAMRGDGTADDHTGPEHIATAGPHLHALERTNGVPATAVRRR